MSNIMATDGFIDSDIMFFMMIETAWVSEEQLCYLSFSKLIYVMMAFDKRNHSLIFKVCAILLRPLIFPPVVFLFLHIPFVTTFSTYINSGPFLKLSWIQ